MAKIIRHKDESSGASLYPITKQSAVYDDVGKSLDVTITDINNDIEKKEDKHQRITITIPVSAWTDNTCVMTVTGILTTSTLMVSPVYESEQAYSTSGVCCVSQDVNELTFTCTSAPEEDLVVNVVVFGSASELNLDDTSIAQLLNNIQENNTKVSELEYTINSIEDSVFDLENDIISIERGGTNATDAATARTNLGITPENISAAKADLSNASGTLGGQVIANTTAVTTIGTAQVRNIKAGTADLTAGSSALATGEIYFVYE